MSPINSPSSPSSTNSPNLSSFPENRLAEDINYVPVLLTRPNSTTASVADNSEEDVDNTFDMEKAVLNDSKKETSKDHQDLNYHLNEWTRPMSRSRSTETYRSNQSGMSEQEIYGVMDQESINLQRTITLEKILSSRGVDKFVNETVANTQSDIDGAEFKEIDPEIVTFDGPDDPENPRNWTTGTKYVTLILAALMCLVSPLSSSIVSPAVPVISEQFDVTNSTEQALIVSIFVLAWAICPLFLAPLSEMYGRRIVLNISIVLLVIFNVACGLSRSYAQMIVFRFLAGCAGSPPLSIGAGTIADMFNEQDRNLALAFFSAGPSIGPVLAPVIAGFVVQYLNWRWVFWILSMINGVVAVCSIVFMKETYAPALLAWKAKKLRKETGNIHLHTVYELNSIPFHKRLYIAVTRPMRLLLFHPIVQGLGLYMSFIYGFMYLMLVTFPALWTNDYHFSSGVVGLMYLSMGIGFLFGLLFFVWSVQWVYLELTKRNGGVAEPEFRIPLIVSSALLCGIGLIWYGWSAQVKLHWVMPSLGAMIFGFGLIGMFQCVQNYLIDMNPRFAASTVAAAAVFRSFFGFGFPLFGASMYAKLGYGWANTMTGLICFALGIPFPAIIYFYGRRLRAWSNKRFQD